MKGTISLVVGLIIGILISQILRPFFFEVPIEEQPQEPIKLLFAGDIMPSRYVAKAMREHGYDFPFIKVHELINSSDIAFANLESPVLSGEIVPAGAMRFRTDPEFLPELSKAGIDIVSLANNHAYDHGVNGLTQTMNILKKHNIRFTGAGTGKDAYAPTYIVHDGVRFAYIAVNDPAIVPPRSCAGAGTSTIGTACLDEQLMTSSINTAKKQADFIIVSMHAGQEYVDEPDSTQTKYARLAIDAGADIVIGHHPHVIQSRELYKGKWIYYSLGNFIFDQNWSRNTTLGLVLIVSVDSTNLSIDKIEHKIISIQDFAQPEIANETDTYERYTILGLP